jgi:hypothetical protein
LFFSCCSSVAALSVLANCDEHVNETKYFATAIAHTQSISQGAHSSRGYSGKNNSFSLVTLVTLVNDSEYSRSTDAKSILSLSCIYIVSPDARCCCSGSCRFLLLLRRESV